MSTQRLTAHPVRPAAEGEGPLAALRRAVGLPYGADAETAFRGEPRQRQIERARRGRRRHARVALVLTTALALLAALGMKPSPQLGILLLATSVAILGLPHGATDLLLARSMVGPSWSTRWAWLTAASYLALAALVVAFWIAWPAAGLVLFALLSLLHFGLADLDAGAPNDGWTAVEVVGRGSVALALPVMFHPESMGRVVAWLVPGTSPVVFLGALPTAFDVVLSGLLAALVVTFFRDLTRGPRRRARAYEVLALVAAAAVLPPLAFFALYFCGWHSMRHAVDVAAAMPEAQQGPAAAARAYILTSLPFTLAALVLGACAYLLLRTSASPNTALAQVVFVGLAALTVPHMVLVDARRAWPLRSAACTTKG